MQLINIFPVANADMEFEQPMHMFLTHLVEKYPHYAKIARQVDGYKILDNSLIELGGAVDILRVIEAAEKIQADEIILPDVFQDGAGTLEAVDRALDTIDSMFRGKCPFKLMAVAQGKDYTEWYECYEKFLDCDEIDVIGIPKVCAKMLPGGRPEVMRTARCNLLAKPHHLLGLWYSVTELMEYKYPEHIRSCDTVHLNYLVQHRLGPLGVRPDGYTLDLENEKIAPALFRNMLSQVHRRLYDLGREDVLK